MILHGLSRSRLSDGGNQLISAESASEILNLVPILHKNTRCVIGPLTDSTVEPYFAVPRQLAKSTTQLIKRKIDRARNTPGFKFLRIAHIHEQNRLRSQLPPISQWQITAQMVGSDHSGVIDRVLRGAELWRIAKLRFLEIINCSPQLDRSRDDIYPFIDVGFAHGLRAENPPIGFAKDEFDIIGFEPGK